MSYCIVIRTQAWLCLPSMSLGGEYSDVLMRVILEDICIQSESETM